MASACRTFDFIAVYTKFGTPSTDDKTIAESNRFIALDKFDTLTSSLTEGLPREIALRQQQYAYYRDLLLNFPKPAPETPRE